jgi:hypothetical protein
MKYRRLSPTGDYTFGFGNASFISDIDAVAQAIGTKLKLFQGEWWENINEGLPFFQEIAGHSDINAIDLLIQARILEVPNVVSIESYASNIDKNRRYTATVTVNTAFGSLQTGVNL